MAHYINKDALVAEIERLEKKNNESENVYDFGTEHALKSIRSFLDTLEVKEVDLEEESLKWIEEHQGPDGAFSSIDFAKHFFELGMTVNNKAQKGE